MDLTAAVADALTTLDALDHVDLVCDALGVHPTELYGSDYYQAAAA